jgi:hypothetical protein
MEKNVIFGRRKKLTLFLITAAPTAAQAAAAAANIIQALNLLDPTCPVPSVPSSPVVRSESVSLDPSTSVLIELIFSQ